MLIFINVLLNTCHVNFSIVSIGAWFSIKKEHIHEKKNEVFFFFFFLEIMLSVMENYLITLIWKPFHRAE